MNHLALANQFNSFAYELVTNHTRIDDKIQSLQDDVFLRRILFSRYYYAFYHKYLAHDSELSSKTGPGLHEQVLKKIESCGDVKLHQVFLKLRNLRIWADYKDYDRMALTVNLQNINSDVFSIVKRTNISC